MVCFASGPSDENLWFGCNGSRRNLVFSTRALMLTPGGRRWLGTGSPMMSWIIPVASSPSFASKKRCGVHRLANLRRGHINMSHAEISPAFVIMHQADTSR